jgi:hypothetical protein
MPAVTPVAQRLAGEGIADSGQALRQLASADLQRLFASANSGRIKAPRVIKNLFMRSPRAAAARGRAWCWTCVVG